MSFAIWILSGVVAMMCMSAVLARRGHHRSVIWLMATIVQLWFALGTILLNRDWTSVAIDLAFAATWFAVYLRQRPPRNRRKLRKLIGAKARALLATVAASMPKARPRIQPSPA